MLFNCSFNFYKDEEGEYSICEKSSLSDIENVISKSWPNQKEPNDLRLILITNKRGQYLILKQVKKGVYEVFYLPKTTSFHFHCKSRIELVSQTVHLFYSSELDHLRNILNKTRNNRRYVRTDIFKSHRYRISKKRLIEELKWLIFGLPAGLMFLTLGVKALSQNDSSALISYLAPIILLAGLYLWLPGLFIHWQYYRDNKDITIEISRGSNEIKILVNGIEKHYKKSDIKKVLKTSQDKSSLNSSFMLFGVPWSEYGYTEIEFKSGEIINMTNLVVDQLFILDKFKYDDIKKYKVQRILPFLKRNTTIEI